MSVYSFKADRGLRSDILLNLMLTAGSVSLIWATIHDSDYAVPMGGCFVINIGSIFSSLIKKRISRIECSDSGHTFRFMFRMPDQHYAYSDIDKYRSACELISNDDGTSRPGCYYFELEFNDGFSFTMTDGAEGFW